MRGSRHLFDLSENKGAIKGMTKKTKGITPEFVYSLFSVLLLCYVGSIVSEIAFPLTFWEKQKMKLKRFLWKIKGVEYGNF